MKNFRVTYVPHGKEDKEWIDKTAKNEQELIANFTEGTYITSREYNPEEDE